MSTQIHIEPGQVTDLPIAKLMPDPDQPRKSFDVTLLEQLAGSILKRGIQVPLLVRQGLRGKYIIHDGERRYRAAKLAKLKTLPALLIDAGDESDVRTGQLTVNNLREQLKPMEIARLLADLQRKHFASINDLAAHLENSGLPAMTKKQIQEAIALVDLPDWAQDMIDAGQLEASVATRLQIALRIPAVLKDAKTELERQAKWSGRVTGNDMKHAIRTGFREHAVDLDRTQSYYAGDASAVHFNPKTACKGCEHLVSVDGAKFCMNRTEFERKNAEAKAAGLLPGGAKPPKGTKTATQPDETEKKAEKRATTLAEKAREYLHAYLIRRLVRHMQGAGEGGQIDITDELLAWHAMKRPGAHSHDRQPAGLVYSACQEAGVKSLEDILAWKNDQLDSAKLHAAIEIAHDLKWRETQVLCHELWSDSIDAVWIMDDGFTNLFRKAELVHLATVHQLDPAEGKAWDKLKAAELKTAILERTDLLRRPQVLQDIYASVNEPYVYKAWSPGNDDEDDESLDDD